jgi:hypothetical protein
METPVFVSIEQFLLSGWLETADWFLKTCIKKHMTATFVRNAQLLSINWADNIEIRLNYYLLLSSNFGGIQLQLPGIFSYIAIDFLKKWAGKDNPILCEEKNDNTDTWWHIGEFLKSEWLQSVGWYPGTVALDRDAFAYYRNTSVDKQMLRIRWNTIIETRLYYQMSSNGPGGIYLTVPETLHQIVIDFLKQWANKSAVI